MSQVRTNSIVPIGGVPGGASGGGIIQTVSTTKTDSFTFSVSQGSFTDITGMSVSITPRSSSNKICVFVSLGSSGSGMDALYRIVRDSTVIGAGTAGTIGNGFNCYQGNDGGKVFSTGFYFLDSPATTSAITYKIQGTQTGGSGTVHIGRRQADSSAGYSNTIMVMEVSG